MRKQKLLTKELERCLPPLYDNENKKDPLVCGHFFLGGWDWYPMEYSKDERVFFGYVAGLECELGYFSLDELEGVRNKMGLGVERDTGFKPKPLSKVKEELRKNGRCGM